MFKNKVTLGTLFLVVLLVAGAVAHGWYVESELHKLRRQNRVLNKVAIAQATVSNAHSKQLEKISSRLRAIPNRIYLQTISDLDISGIEQDISSLATRVGSIETKFSYRPGGINCKESIFGTLQCGL